MDIQNKRIPDEEFAQLRKEVLTQWPQAGRGTAQRRRGPLHRRQGGDPGPGRDPGSRAHRLWQGRSDPPGPLPKLSWIASPIISSTIPTYRRHSSAVLSSTTKVSSLASCSAQRPEVVPILPTLVFLRNSSSPVCRSTTTPFANVASAPPFLLQLLKLAEHLQAHLQAGEI